MKKNRKFTLGTTLGTLALLFLVLTSCEATLQEADVAYAAPIVDNIFLALAEEDYSKFSQDLSLAMKEAIEKIGFQAMLKDLESSLGAYQGRIFKKAVKAKVKNMALTIVTYSGQFEKDSAATITLYISNTQGKYIVEGFSTAASGASK